MAGDYENIHRLNDMNDAELQELIAQELQEQPELDHDRIEVVVSDGVVRLQGRVGTEHELQVAQALIADGLGVTKVSNELVIDPLGRAEHSEAADEAVTEDGELEGMLGERAKRTEDSADHLQENAESDLYGTQDMQEAIEEGRSYNPPAGPIQEGHWSEETH